MELEKLLLKKEELPIFGETNFYIPIHPKLLDANININEDIASKVFPQAAEEWYNELKEYAANIEDNQTKEWIDEVFLKSRPKIEQIRGRQCMEGWEDKHIARENGFVEVFEIERNFGGSLYFNQSEDSTHFVNLKGNMYIKFPKEKVIEFGYNEIKKISNELEGVDMYVYKQHNIDNYPGALFLRNWAILYMNEAMKQVFKK